MARAAAGAVMRHLEAVLLLAVIGPRVRALPFDGVHLLAVDYNAHWAAVNAAAIASINFTTTLVYANDNNKSSNVNKAVDDLVTLAGSKRIAVVTNWRSGGTAKLLRAGAAVFSMGKSFDYDRFNLNTSQVLGFGFGTNNLEGGKFTGRELCRRRGHSGHKVVHLVSNCNCEAEARNYEAERAFRHACPDVDFEVMYTVVAKWSREKARDEMRKIFMVEPTLTTVIAYNDASALGALDAADEILPQSVAKRLVVTGFDNSEDARPYLENKRLFSSVDQLTQVPGVGMWHSIPLLIQEVQDEGLTSADSIGQHFGIQGNVMLTATLGVTSDAPGLVTGILQATYSSSVRATPQGGAGPSDVLLLVSEFQVSNFDVSSQLFQAAFVIDVSWYDERLMWEERQYRGALQWPVEEIWTPNVMVENRESTDPVIFQGRANIAHTGKVTVRSKLQGQFHCPMNGKPFPFTVHECGIRLRSYAPPEDVRLHVAEGGFLIAGWPSDFRPLEVLETAAVRGTTYGDYATFEFRGVHKTNFIMTGYVLAAWLLNMISFAQFYIPGGDDRTGFAMATILAAMVLQMEAKGSNQMTWLDIFLLLSLVFQVLAFVVSVMARHTTLKDQNKVADATGPLAPESQASHAWDRQGAVCMKGVQKGVQLMYGIGQSTFSEDRWSRRLMLPAYLGLSMMLTFLPSSGGMDVSGHPEHGLACPLFWLSAAGLVPFLLGAGFLPVMYAQKPKIDVRDLGADPDIIKADLGHVDV